MNKIMKRIIPVLAFAMLFSACGEDVQEKTKIPDQPETTTEQTLPAAETAAEPSVTDTLPSATSAETASETQPTITTAVSETETSAAREPATMLPGETVPGDGESTQEQEDTSDVIGQPASKAYVLYCVDDDEILAKKRLDKKISIASTTKLVTVSVMLKYLDPSDYVTVGEEVWLAKPESTLSYIEPGMQIPVYDLIAAILLPSGNDAAYTAAVNTAWAASGDYYMSYDDAVEYFCGLMNDFAAEQGMTGTHFANPEGWDNKEHYSTAGDLLKAAQYVLSVPVLREVIGEYQWYYDAYVWTNTNLFLDPYSEFYRDDCIGIKTGTTERAGACLVSAFNIDDKDYICLVMGCAENEDRYRLVEKILDENLD